MAANTLLTSVVTGGSSSHATVAEEANAFSTDFVSAGVVGTIGVNAGSGGTGSFCVNADASPDMGVTIKAGQAYVTATPSGQNSQVLRVRAAADYTAYTINANASGSTKYDWVYLSISATNANTPSADASNVASFVTSRSSSNTTDNGSPPTYGLVLAVITVANAASSITNGNIQDKRIGSSLTTSTASSSTGWNALGQVPNSVAANGNRAYTLTFNAVDITGTVSPGMRLKTSRTVPAPTQCTSLNGTTQFYNRASASLTGMTFTNNFVVSAWVKVSDYSINAIASRYNGTSGFIFDVNASGQVGLTGFNSGAANFSKVLSYQSLPLNRWVHVSAQLDMATFTATPTTSYVMFDGLDTPAAVTRGGTNPTALVQAGNLEIGSQNAGSDPFLGKIAQVAIYSAKVTQANVLATLPQGLAGTETSLISAYSFNNSINDLNANANNLTAQASAVATNTDSPFGGQADGTISSTLDFAEILTTSFSTNTTLVVRCPDGNTIPASGGVGAVSYATVQYPYQWPGISNVLGSAIVMVNSAVTTIAQIPGLTCAVTIPPGRRVKATMKGRDIYNATLNTANKVSIWDGVVNSGTKVAEELVGGSAYAANMGLPLYLSSPSLTPSSTSKTYNAGMEASGGTINLEAGATYPAELSVELV